MHPDQVLPSPYQAEAQVIAQRLQRLQGQLDWAAAAQVAAPWVQAVRAQPAPLWAMESLLREYPISSAEGLALMRLAEALLRVPDMDTAIALTAGEGEALAEKGALDKARRNLARLENLCGADCPPSRELASAIAKGTALAKGDAPQVVSADALKPKDAVTPN